VRKFYGDTCALDGVNLRVAEGEFVSIIGPNGAGKDDAGQRADGLTAPSSGSVRFKDRAWSVGPGQAGAARHGALVPAW